MGKTHIGELFFKERVLKLPSPWPGRFRITIAERHLRLLITSLIVLFLLMLGSSLLVQLTDSRTRHVAEQNRLSALHGQLVAQHIKADMAAAQAAARQKAGMRSRLGAPCAELPRLAAAARRLASSSSMGSPSSSPSAGAGAQGRGGRK